MPRKRIERDEEESESEFDEENEGDSDDIDGDSSKRPRARSQSQAKKSNPRKTTAKTKNKMVSEGKSNEEPIDEDASEPDEDGYVPSTSRFTDRGGYAHTTQSRLAISRANKGNTPWNKGKNRSGTDRAKIAAGVRARNRAILLEKLQKLGMTEEEWNAKKKQIKLARERLRRARKANEEREEEKEKQRKMEAFRKAAENQAQSSNSNNDSLSKLDQNSGGKDGLLIDSSENLNSSQVSAFVSTHTSQLCVSYVTSSFVLLTKKQSYSASGIQQQQPQETAAPMHQQHAMAVNQQDDEETDGSSSDDEYDSPTLNHSIFARYYRWHPHPFDAPETSYDKHCPNGGPGGFTCCESCTTLYSQYLSDTYKDIEQQKITNIGAEVSQLLEFIGETKTKLEETIQAVRKKPPPKRAKLRK